MLFVNLLVAVIKCTYIYYCICQVREVKMASGTAWITAVLCSLPQLIIWETRNVIPCLPNGFVQCVTILQPESREMVNAASIIVKG